MSYATGSGDFNALMTAVQTFALADGWTEVGGIGTGFPLASPGNTVRAVDWASETFIGTDFTEGAGGGQFTGRWLKFGIGATGAGATANAAVALGNPVAAGTVDQRQRAVIANGSFQFLEWHIFSDPASGADYIHVAARFANSANPEVWTHFSFGEVDRKGMSYAGIAYAATVNRYGWAQSTESGGGSRNWNSESNTSFPFAGAVGERDAGYSNTTYMIGGTSPVNSAAGYPANDVLHLGGAGLLDVSRPGRDAPGGGAYLSGTGGYRLATAASYSRPMPFTGAVSLAPIPFVLMSGSAAGSRGTFCGVFPGARLCSMQDYNPGDQVTFGAETWQLFPLLRQTANGFLAGSGVVTSGQTGMAYKRVV